MSSDTDTLLTEMRDVKVFVGQWGSPWMEASIGRAIERIAKQVRRPRYRFARTDLQAHVTAGLTIDKIAAHYGCSCQTIWRWLKTFNLPHPKRRKRLPSFKQTFPSHPWTEEEDNQLRDLWVQHLTCSQIAERMHQRSRNMVIGRAHRLKLPDRASPIKRAA